MFAASFIEPAWGGDYMESAHGQNISRTVMTNAGYGIGNCAHCHEQHASLLNEEPLPQNGPSPYLTFDTEENVCYGCHSAAGTVGSADVKVKVDIDAGDTINGSHHDVLIASGKHRYGEDTTAFDASSKHVECTDCHNPHAAKIGNHDDGTYVPTSTTHNVSNVLKGASGVDFNPYPSWGAGCVVNPGTLDSSVTTAVTEYQICFKCHSSANGGLAGWGGADALAWTDVALEFNPANASSHPVVAPSGTRALNANQVLAPWIDNVGNQTMYCSDCHEGNTVAGPHGSSIRWMLAGVNKAWPFDAAADNGKTTGTYKLVNQWETNLGTEDGLFCRNCHPYFSNSINLVHTKGSHGYFPCVGCHIRVPHGGKVQRLIAADLNDVMPDRYTADGIGGLPPDIVIPYSPYIAITSRLLKFKKANPVFNQPDSYVTNNCYTGSYVKGNCVAGGAPNHSDSTLATDYWE